MSIKHFFISLSEMIAPQRYAALILQVDASKRRVDLFPRPSHIEDKRLGHTDILLLLRFRFELCRF